MKTTAAIVPDLEFRTAKGWRIFLFILLPPFMLGFIYMGLSPFLENGPSFNLWFLPLLALALLLLCAWGFVDLVKGRLVISADRLVRISAFKRKELPFSVVKGFTMEEKYLVIHPSEEGYPRIKVSTYTERMEELKEELGQKFTDLDQQLLQQEEEEILGNEELGTTEGERALALERARKLAGRLNLAGTICMLWLFFFPAPYKEAVTVALAFPLFVAFLLYRYKGIIRIEGKTKSAYPDLSGALLMPALSVGLRAFLDFNLLSYGRLLLAAGVLTLLVTAVFFLITRPTGPGESKMLPRMLLLLFFAAVYSFGACVELNCLLDKSPARHFSSRILNKRVSSGKHTSYYLKMEPWGPQTEAKEVSVDQELYNLLNRGENANIYLLDGALGVPWFEITE